MNVDNFSNKLFPVLDECRGMKVVEGYENTNNRSVDVPALLTQKRDDSFQRRLEDVVKANREAGGSSAKLQRPDARTSCRGKGREQPTRTASTPADRQSPETVRRDRQNRSHALGKQTDSVISDGESKAEREPETGAAFCKEPGVVEKNVPAGEASMKPCQEIDVDGMVADEAARIIREVILAVSNELDLHVPRDIGNLELVGAGEMVVEELSEILFTLAGIARIMDTAVSEGTTLQVGGVTLDAQQLADIEQVIRQEMFRMEWALSMLGLSREVNAKVSGKMMEPAQGDIPVAIEPASKSMPVIHLNMIMAETEEVPDIDVLVKRLAVLVREHGDVLDAKQETSFAKGLVAGKTIPAEPGAFETPMMRAILNIDNEQSTAGENVKAAAGNEKMDLPQALNVVLGRSLGVEMVEARPTETLNGEVQGTARPADAAMAATGAVSRILDKVEESVMLQIMNRYNQAVKAGALIHEMKISLRPESLGQVHLKVQMEGDVVMTRIHVENQQVKQIIENNLQLLKDALAQHNLQAGAFSVNVGTGDSGKSTEGDGKRNVGDDIVSSGLDEDAEDPVSQLPPGGETGRRFGDNTVEYFA